MKISVKAKTNVRKAHIKQIDATHFEISVKEPAHEGEANLAIIKALQNHFDIPQSHISLVAGHSSKTKIFKIEP